MIALLLALFAVPAFADVPAGPCYACEGVSPSITVPLYGKYGGSKESIQSQAVSACRTIVKSWHKDPDTCKLGKCWQIQCEEMGTGTWCDAHPDTPACNGSQCNGDVGNPACNADDPNYCAFHQQDPNCQ